MRAVSCRPGQERCACRCEQRGCGIEEAYEQVFLANVQVRWNDRVKYVEMIEVVARIGQGVDEHNDYMPMAVLELVRNHNRSPTVADNMLARHLLPRLAGPSARYVWQIRCTY